MTVSTLTPTSTPITPVNEEPSLKSEVSKARRDAFSKIRSLSNSFTKQRCSHNRKVRFDFQRNTTHLLDGEVDRTPMFMTYQDKAHTADDVEETCYHYNDSDYVHPYVMHLIQTWDRCANVECKNGNPVRSLEAFTKAQQVKLVNSMARGLEKKLHTDLKRHTYYVNRTVLEVQKSYKHLPAVARAKAIRNKYKKATGQSKVFALTIASGDAAVAQKLYATTAATA